MTLQEQDKGQAQSANSVPAKSYRQGQWIKGQSGNPKGKPMAARHRLNDAFINSLSADFIKHGSKAIVKMREADPSAYVRVCASLLPKDVFVHQSPLAELSETELQALIRAAQRAVAMAEHDSTEP
jgi:hypothetical protein